MRNFFLQLSPVLAAGVCTLSAPSALAAPETTDITTTARATVRGNEAREFDWAKLRAGARIAYVSSGPRTLSDRMIDNDLQTVFPFSESDRSPTVIVELAWNARLHRVSTVFKAEDAKLDIFLLDELPKDAADLRFATPHASVVELPDEHGTVSVDFSVGSARYVALRWTLTKWHEPFTVTQISAFSNEPPNVASDQDVRLAESANTFATTQLPSIPVVSP
jgi:hypothetical protein